MSVNFLGVGLFHHLLTPYLALHIPDGFLSPSVSLFTWIIAVVLISFSLKKVRGH